MRAARADGRAAAVPDSSTRPTRRPPRLARHPSFADTRRPLFVARWTCAPWLISAYGARASSRPRTTAAAARRRAAPPARRARRRIVGEAVVLAARRAGWRRRRGACSTVSTAARAPRSARPSATRTPSPAPTPHAVRRVGAGASVIDALASTSPPRTRPTLARPRPRSAATRSACGVAAGGDAESPPCARLVLSGRLVNATGTDEEAREGRARAPPCSSSTGRPRLLRREADRRHLAIDTYGGGPTSTSTRTARSRRAPAAAAPQGATEAPFCAQVAENGGCCPACGYTWDGAACTTDEKADTPYCASLLLPAQSGCCSYCGHAWSEAQGKCVKAEDAAITA